jgi:hypothetical protein
MKRSQFTISDGFRNIETVIAEIVDVPVSERLKPGDICSRHGFPTNPKRLDCSIHVKGVPEHNDVQHQSQRSELILLAFAVSLPQFISASVKSGPRKAVSPFVQVQLGQDVPSEYRIAL